MMNQTVIAGMLALAGTIAAADEAGVWYQAHRGGLLEAPENTMVAFRHAWSCPGAVPEVDIRTTKDGVVICLHNETPAVTTDAPEPYRDMNVREIPYDVVRQWDAGSGFDAKYAGEPVPKLTELFDEMKGRPERQLYLDVKDVAQDQLLAMIEEYDVSKQVIFVHGSQETCIALSKLFPGARTMTWLSGKPSQIRNRFESMSKNGFEGISQLQFHLRTRSKRNGIEYVFDDDYLRQAVAITREAGTELQLRPFDFDVESLRKLIDLGVRWYVADEPRRFSDTVAAAMKR
ncbi:MAG: glycerophosphodiester phosphodiesterase [Nitrospiraceae bacterium]|nr:glycerophosphodiester phosphodiesterase [Nitrospiraceae bacterium]